MSDSTVDSQHSHDRQKTVYITDAPHVRERQSVDSPQNTYITVHNKKCFAQNTDSIMSR